MNQETKDEIAREASNEAMKLGSYTSDNPYPEDSEEFGIWADAWNTATVRLVSLFEAWLSLGHSIPKLAIGQSGQALGPMVAGLIQSNGNAAGPILVGALASHAGIRLSEILQIDEFESRELFEATQYAVLGHDLPPELSSSEDAVSFFNDAGLIDKFRLEETEVSERDSKKVALASFDLSAFLKALLIGIDPE